MADFCKQCADEMDFETDLDHLLPEEKFTAEDGSPLYVSALCEGCGPTQVDYNGVCVGNCDIESHGTSN